MEQQMRNAMYPAVIAILFISFSLLVGCAGREETDDSASDLAARYDGGYITEQEVCDYTAEYRESRGYSSDEIWAQHLIEQGLVAKTWRERAVGSIVEERLELARARDLGIVADEDQVDQQIESAKRLAGVSQDDDQAWEAYLESIGTTSEAYRADLEDDSIIEQLLAQEISVDTSDSAAIVDEYIQKNLVSRVIRHYRALCFDTQEQAREALDDLVGLAGDELSERFDSWLVRDDSEETTPLNGGDIGWDIENNLGSVQDDLNSEMVSPGALSQMVHMIDGRYYVLLCTDRFAFDLTTTYDLLPDDGIRTFLAKAATYANWSDLTADYVGKLREAAHVQVSEMPQGLPYDVDTQIEALKASLSESSAASSAAAVAISSASNQAGE